MEIAGVRGDFVATVVGIDLSAWLSYEDFTKIETSRDLAALSADLLFTGLSACNLRG